MPESPRVSKNLNVCRGWRSKALPGVTVSIKGLQMVDESLVISAATQDLHEYVKIPRSYELSLESVRGKLL